MIVMFLRLLAVLAVVWSAFALRASADQAQSVKRPNLEGTWNSATTTPLERPAQLKDKPFFTPQEAAEWERQYAERNAEPTPEAAAKSKGTGTYNSNYQIVQTANVILVHAEMLSEARLIYLDGRPHPPSRIQQWSGHSVGRWEGNTLVVDTTNFKDGRGFYGDAGGNFAWDRHLHLVERFSLMDRDTLLYQFEIDNPTAYTRPWKGELTMTRTNDRIYEFACHEANYSLENMLRGQRAAEGKPVGARRR